MDRFNGLLDSPQPEAVQPQEQTFEFDLGGETRIQKKPEQAKIEEDPEGFWDWAKLEGARTFLESASLNSMDNASSALVATYHAFNDPNPIEDTWKTYYDIVQKEYRKGQDAYAKEFPRASTALGVAGAIASPANYIAAPVSVLGMGARAGVEGAIAGGFLSESKDEILSNAAEGAMWGASVGLGVGYMFKGLSRKNIEKDLESIDEAGNKVFTSITLAANTDDAVESGVQGLYRDIVSVTYLAKTLIKNQEQLIIDPIEKRIANSKQNLSLIGRDVKANVSLLGRKFSEAKTGMAEGFSQLNRRIGDDINDATDVIKESNNVLKEASKQGYSEFSVGMNQQIVKDSAGFREQVLNRSYPVNIGGDARQKLVKDIKMAKTPQAQYDLIDELWQDAGFESIKKNKEGLDRVISIKAESLSNAIYSRITSSDKLSARVGNKEGLGVMITNNIGFLGDKISKGRIKVSTLMTYRNELAMKANSMADTTLGDADRSVLRAAVDVIDSSIMLRLPKEKDVVAFKADKEAWAMYSKFKDAVQMKSKAGEFGMFEPKDYIDVLRAHSKGITGKGKGLLQEEAEIVNSRIVRNTQSITDNAHQVMKDVTAGQVVSLNKLAKKKRGLLDAAKKESSKKFTTTSQKYEQSVNKASRGIEIQKLNTELDEISDHLALLNGQRSQKNPSWFQSIAAVGLLGGLITGGGAGVIAVAAVGTGAGLGLATKGGQKFVAGQTGVQNTLRNNPQVGLQTSKLLGRIMGEEQVKEQQQQQQ